MFKCKEFVTVGNKNDKKVILLILYNLSGWLLVLNDLYVVFFLITDEYTKNSIWNMDKLHILTTLMALCFWFKKCLFSNNLSFFFFFSLLFYLLKSVVVPHYHTKDGDHHSNQWHGRFWVSRCSIQWGCVFIIYFCCC